MERPDRFDPYRVLGVPPGAPLEEVKAAYRRLAKRHHPDAAGPGQLARFLTVQAAYETIVRSRGGATRSQGGAAHAPGPAARGAQRDADRDWYTAAREAARARSRAGRSQGPGPRARGGGATAGGPPPGAGSAGAAGAGSARAAGAAGGAGSGAHGGRARGSGQPGGRPGRPPNDAPRDDAWRRRATLGSTTYDDAPAEPPSWDGSAWYGAASGTYWTVNPREYADPRKHGPAYLGRATEWTDDRPPAPFSSARPSGPAATASGSMRDEGAAATAGGSARDGGAAGGAQPRTPEPGDRRTAPGGASGPRPARSGIADAIRAALGGRGRRGTRVG
jgi:hypothetical protein